MNILIEENTIKDKVAKIGAQINHDYANKNPIVIGILKGAFMFLADLIRVIEIPVEIDFLAISSYDGKASSGVVKISKDLAINIEDRDIIVVEDVVDSGRTINYIVENLKTRRPRSIAICALLNKKDNRIVNIPLTYIGFNIPPVFVVGYGLDHNDQHRNLPYIGVYDGK